MWGCFGGRFVFVVGGMAEKRSKMSMNNSNLADNLDCDERDDGVVNAANLEAILEEQDIPGATLLKPVEQCNMAILKRWLLCRGAKISGKKNELVQR